MKASGFVDRFKLMTDFVTIYLTEDAAQQERIRRKPLYGHQSLHKSPWFGLSALNTFAI
jgi:hypothetical protein